MSAPDHNANGWGSDGRCWKCGQEWPCDGYRPGALSHNVDTKPPQRLTDETGGNMTPGKLPPSQQDLDAIRERHEPTTNLDGSVGCCAVCAEDWPCDTRVVLDALELAAFDRDLYDRQRDAARADADRLAEALRAWDIGGVNCWCGAAEYVKPTPHSTACLQSREALRLHEEATR